MTPALIHIAGGAPKSTICGRPRALPTAPKITTKIEEVTCPKCRTNWARIPR